MTDVTSHTDMDAIIQRLAIQERYARYAFYCDTFQIDPLMTLWVNDNPVFDESEVGTGYHSGQDGIRQFFIEGVFSRRWTDCCTSPATTGSGS